MKNDSFGIYQYLEVDAISTSAVPVMPGLPSCGSERVNPNGVQPFWDTGYLGQFTPSGVSLYDASPNSGITQVDEWTFAPGNSPITETGWYKLGFGVSGTGADTELELSVDGTIYISTTYNAPAALDSGYIGLGRPIRYDNASGFSSMNPVPVPGAIGLFLLGSGLISLIGFSNSKAGRG